MQAEKIQLFKPCGKYTNLAAFLQVILSNLTAKNYFTPIIAQILLDNDFS